ncbi:MAG: nuclear mRNA export, poly(A)+RNA binding protein [Cirrosporium novae-zelandiae]|nr:MAG: nuclear mRNA export, poly(A)+RNA binding protein [Cirrosporium novae-zelandiae]
MGTHTTTHKRRGGPRIDKDGDLVMDTPTNRGGINKRARTRLPNSTQHHQQDGPKLRRSVDLVSAQGAIIRGIANGNARLKGPKAAVDDIVKEFALGSKAVDRSNLQHLKVYGWHLSKAKHSAHRGTPQLVGFLERKANTHKTTGEASATIQRSRIEGNSLIISVKAEDKAKFLRIDGYNFAGANITISEYGPRRSSNSSPPNSQSINTADQDMTELIKETMVAFLNRRYNASERFLDLSALGSDPQLMSVGMFSEASRVSKFFRVLMTICDAQFDTFKAKQAAVISVSLANNQLPDIANVITLARSFPALKNLDLSNNQLRTVDDLYGWKYKFRQLDHLIITGNPIESQLNYHEELLKWFPKLRMLNNIQVRSDEEIAQKSKLPIKTLPPIFDDEGGIGETFIKMFFPGFDSDRTGLANFFYTPTSTFSLSVNTSAQRAQATSAELKPAAWDHYIKKSRNLNKITHLPARMSRLFTGPQSISDAWKTLPPTRHPDLMNDSPKWLIECHQLQSLPDPTHQYPQGVTGLLVTVHGQFDEIDLSTSKVLHTRSFDRTFTLGPGINPGEVKVYNDLMILRAYGGHEAWIPDSTTSNTPQPPEGYGQPLPGKTDEQIQKEHMVLQVMDATNLTMDYSIMCLEGSQWNLETAAANFNAAKDNLPREAFR